MHLTRRSFVLAGAATALTVATACGAPNSGQSDSGSSSGAVPKKPSKPVALTILDVAGNLQLTQGMIDEFVKEHSDIVSRVTTTQAPAPELAGKIKAQQKAGRVGIDVVLTGVDGLSAGIQQGLWQKLLPEQQSRLSNMSNYLDAAQDMQGLAGGYGVTVTYYPSGPLIEYLPSKVKNPPKTAQELLAYAKAHPGKVQYARPSNSGPGRTLLMGLPYILGDSDPKDPVNGWDKTWKYLSDLNGSVSYYPSGTTDTMKNLANGSAEIIASTTGWDINPRVLGTVPKEAQVRTLEGFHWVSDAHYAVVPKGVSADKQAAVLQLLQWMLTPKQQAKAYDDGYFYPGPAIKGVDVTQAPAKSQQAIKDFGRPEYADLIANNPTETPLDAKSLVAAFDRWDREIGSGKVKEASQ
jgi:putative spermidine/putrescine transport system substrate-binding protein